LSSSNPYRSPRLCSASTVTMAQKNRCLSLFFFVVFLPISVQIPALVVVLLVVNAKQPPN
ncbi:hypothetical protein T02_15089, partial [Trichinella nativa]